MFNNDPIDSKFDSDIELARQESEYVSSLKKHSEKLINAIADEKFITVGEARRMSRLSVDISQFPAIQKVFDVIAESNILASETIENEYEDEDESDMDFSDNANVQEVQTADISHPSPTQKQKRIRRKKKKLIENLSENSPDTEIDEISEVCADDLFGMINNIEKNNVRKDNEPLPQTPLVEQHFEFDPYNRKMNDYDMDELTEDIPTFDIDSGYKLHNL